MQLRVVLENVSVRRVTAGRYFNLKCRRHVMLADIGSSTAPGAASRRLEAGAVRSVSAGTSRMGSVAAPVLVMHI